MGYSAIVVLYGYHISKESTILETNDDGRFVLKEEWKKHYSLFKAPHSLRWVKGIEEDGLYFGVKAYVEWGVAKMPDEFNELGRYFTVLPDEVKDDVPRFFVIPSGCDCCT